VKGVANAAVETLQQSALGAIPHLSGGLRMAVVVVSG
jgi:hypothetical protein